MTPEPDFRGWATKAGLKCTDGKTIMKDAFAHQDGVRVPLVWQHGHKEAENVLGHVILSHRDEGVWADGYFNRTAKAQHIHEALIHGDLDSMSIWANQLVQRASEVFHGMIREVSLVLAGANPGAKIEHVTIRHADGELEEAVDEFILHNGYHVEVVPAEGDTTSTTERESEEDLTHDNKTEDPDEKTIGEIYEALSDEQKDVVHYMIAEALQGAGADNKDSDAEDLEQTDNDPGTLPDNTSKGTDEMTHNVFENQGEGTREVLSHDAISEIVSDASRRGSLRDAVDAYALKHGIDNIEALFPDAQAADATPQWVKRRTEWVASFMGATNKSPFSRVKTLTADITMEDARARGYVTGNMKKEEFFSVSKRITTPTTVYKKQKLDRDDVVDITDFDVVNWLKGEMRLMLEEEVARAALVGDGRDPSSEDKINEGNIRPIVSDHELFTTTVRVNVADADSSAEEVIDAMILNRAKYKGTGSPVFYTSETWVAKFLLIKDADRRRIYPDLAAVAAAMRVSRIVPVEILEDYEDVVGIMVNPTDYTFGADKGGQTTMFEDFDIDYNQQKYLIETRVSGALTKPKSAVVVRAVAAAVTLVTPANPDFDAVAGELTIVDQTGVIYKNADGDAVLNAAGSPYAVASGNSITVYAEPDTNYAFNTSDNDLWTFTAE